MKLRRVSMLACVLPLILGSCGSSHDADAERRADQFRTAVQGSDGASGCELLSDEVQKELQDSSGKACSTALTEAGLSADGTIEGVSVFGTSAQVRYSDDVVFLGDFPDGWKVIAAGCERQASAPYDCQIHGG